MVRKEEGAEAVEATPKESAPPVETPASPAVEADASSEVGGPRVVTLVDKDGGETLVSHPASLSNLVFGSGYKIKDGERTVEQAAAFLAGEDA